MKASNRSLFPDCSLKLQQATGPSGIISAVPHSDQMFSLHQIETNYFKLSYSHDTGLKNLAPQLFFDNNEKDVGV